MTWPVFWRIYSIFYISGKFAALRDV